MMFGPAALLISIHPTQLPQQKSNRNACSGVGYCIFHHRHALGLAVYSRGSVASPCSQNQVGNREQQANVSWEWDALRGCDISILGDCQDFASL